MSAWADLITDDLDRAAALLRAGELVIFPTETVYGLGADATQSVAIAKVFAAKGRPADNPLIVHVAERQHVAPLIADLPTYAETLLEAFAPGPLTLVGPRRQAGARDVDSSGVSQAHAALSAAVSAGMPTVAVRVPAHAVARDFLNRCGRPVAAPSANLSGRPSATTLLRALQDLGSHVGAAIEGGPCSAGIESTVIDVSASAPQILRLGSISLAALRDVVPSTTIATAEALKLRSPGTRHRHYSPRAAVHLVDACPSPAPARAAFIGLTAPSDPAALALVRVESSPEGYARALFEFLREADSLGVEQIFAQRVQGEGIELALMDRLTRAASG